jgi:hypothetical protein
VGSCGTVLVTGGTGTLGGELARHLVAGRGMRHVLLTSRQGPAAAGAAGLAAELAGNGRAVRIAAGDAADRDALAGVLMRVPVDHPLTAVVHAAGVLDDATVESLTPERVAPVLAAKAAGAWNLHELTAGADLAGFVVYSSAAAVFGSPGQGSYAAGNAFLDALAGYRRDRGLAGLSLGWGFWARRSALTGRLDDTDLSRLRRGGFPADGDRTRTGAVRRRAGLDAAHVVAARLDLSGPLGQDGQVRPLLRGLATASAARPTAAAPPLRPGAWPRGWPR